MKLNKIIIPVVALIILSGCSNPNPAGDSQTSIGDSTTSTSVDTSTSSEPSTTPSVTPETYYDNITAKKGAPLLAQIHDLITTTHTRYTSYEDCKDSDKLIKSDNYDTNHITEFYSQTSWVKEYANATSSGHLNREHLWCQANSSGLWGKEGGGSDMHHIRPTEYSINNKRGNCLYGVVSNRDSSKAYADSSSGKIHAGYLKSGIFEPLDSVKGDVARIVMYVFTHYNSYSNLPGATTNGPGNSEYFGKLNITQNVSGGFALLLKWNNSDPVSEREKARNNYVFTLEGNRNPFIDHPEYASAIWSA